MNLTTLTIPATITLQVISTRAPTQKRLTQIVRSFTTNLNQTPPVSYGNKGFLVFSSIEADVEKMEVVK